MLKKEGVFMTADSFLPTVYGTFKLLVYTSLLDKSEHAVLLINSASDQEYLIRVHSKCLTGDTFFSLRCDCREQLHKSMELVSRAGKGAILYLNQEGRGIGLTNKIKAYALQDQGFDTVEANQSLGLPVDARQYKIAAEILKDLGILKINLLTNNPDKEKQLTHFGINILKTILLEIKPNDYNKSYLATKKRKLSHHLKLV